MKNLLNYLMLSCLPLFVACQQKTETAAPKPIADFEFSASDTSFDINFKNKSQNATVYEWDFGDGKSSKEQNPKHKYPTGGNYIVRLNAIAADQVDRITKSIYIKNTPIARFEFISCDTGSFAPCEVAFFNKSLNAQKLVWDFGDGNSSTKENPRHTYQKGGIFTVSLSVSSDEGTDTSIKTVNIPNAPLAPLANFEINGGDCSAPCLVVFTNISKNASKYAWDFGNGERSDKASPSHEYTQGGTFTVRLTATGKGGIDKVNRTIVIYNTPKADFEIENENCTSPCDIKFINRSTDASLYSWEFSNTRSTLETNPTLTFTTIGGYSVKLTAVAKDGKVSTKTRSFSVK